MARRFKLALIQLSVLASAAAGRTRPGSRAAIGSAPADAGHTLAGILESMMSIGRASSAAEYFDAINIPASDSAPVRVLRVIDVPGEHKVYNLSVFGNHEYVANGVLVSNCDDLRYIFAARLKYVKPRKTERKGNYATDYLEMKKRRAAHKKKMESSRGGSIKMW
jgi:hypothetical protein